MCATASSQRHLQRLHGAGARPRGSTGPVGPSHAFGVPTLHGRQQTAFQPTRTHDGAERGRDPLHPPCQAARNPRGPCVRHFYVVARAEVAGRETSSLACSKQLTCRPDTRDHAVPSRQEASARQQIARRSEPPRPSSRHSTHTHTHVRAKTHTQKDGCLCAGMRAHTLNERPLVLSGGFVVPHWLPMGSRICSGSSGKGMFMACATVVACSSASAVVHRFAGFFASIPLNSSWRTTEGGLSRQAASLANFQ